jgi:epoxyqueuosine reductase
MDKRALTQLVKSKANELGFALVGVTNAEPLAHHARYRSWIEDGRHGKMEYLATERAVDGRSDPKLIRPDCRSVLALGFPYPGPSDDAAPEDGRQYGRIASYANGDDYHEILKPRLRALLHYMEDLVGYEIPNRWYTDSGPLLERELAQRAGLGWVGKNSMLIHPKHGSYFLLAEMLLSIELEPDAAFVTDHCGSCTRCLEACPTDCILPDRTIDASRCVSYLTIEMKDPVPFDMRPLMQDWVFGCDACQTACPWNHPSEASASPWVDLQAELGLSTYEFNRKFEQSPVARPHRRGYLRNIAVALGNSGNEAAVPALGQSLLSDNEPMVRGHAAWALGHIGGLQAEQSLNAALTDERDVNVCDEIRNALDELRGANGHSGASALSQPGEAEYGRTAQNNRRTGSNVEIVGGVQPGHAGNGGDQGS